jgi:hypothetical protein
MDIPTIPQGMSEKEYDRRLRYMQIDSKVVNLLTRDDYVFYLDILREGAVLNQDEALRWKDERIQSLEREITSKELSIRALQKENQLLWKSSIDQIAEEKLKVREIEQRWGNLLGDK